MQKNDSESGGDYVARKIPKKKIKKKQTKQTNNFFFFFVRICFQSVVVVLDKYGSLIAMALSTLGFSVFFFKAKVAPMMPFNLLYTLVCVLLYAVKL